MKAGNYFAEKIISLGLSDVVMILKLWNERYDDKSAVGQDIKGMMLPTPPRISS
jgi:hypothetical protein